MSKPMPDPPAKPRYDTNDPARQTAREEADRLMDDPPAALQAWADSQGVKLTNRDAGIWGSVEQRLDRLGLKSTAIIWRKDQMRVLIESGVTARKLVAKEICMRVIVDRMLASKDQIISVLHAGDESELDCLPKSMRWVACHPLMVKDADKDPVMRSVAAVYEREHKAPNQMARSRLLDCQTDAKARKEFWAEVLKLQKEAKASGPAGGHGGEDGSGGAGGDKSSEEQAILDLDDELVKLAEDADDE
jgi:hypothetical protein